MDYEGIKKVLDSEVGKPIKDFLVSELFKLDSIDTLPDKDVASHQLIQIKARKEAIKVMKSILSQIFTFDEKLKPKDPRDSYHVG